MTAQDRLAETGAELSGGAAEPLVRNTHRVLEPPHAGRIADLVGDAAQGAVHLAHAHGIGDAVQLLRPVVAHRHQAQPVLQAHVRLATDPLPYATGASIEVKLTLTKEEFDRANIAAEETSRLRLRAHPRRSALPTLATETHGKNVDGVWMPDPHITDEQHEAGVALSEARFGGSPVTFALFAFGGIENIGTIRSWMKGATISLVCCLSAGCTLRNGSMRVGANEVSSPGAAVEAPAEDALWHFSETLVRTTQHHTRIMNSFQADFDKYAPYGKSLVVQTTVIDEPVVPDPR